MLIGARKDLDSHPNSILNINFARSHFWQQMQSCLFIVKMADTLSPNIAAFALKTEICHDDNFPVGAWCNDNVIIISKWRRYVVLT